MLEPKLGHLLGAVLHDLYSPLNAAQLHLQRLLQPNPAVGVQDAAAADALDSALRTLRRVERLCQDGLRLAGLLQGQKILLQPVVCSLQAGLRILGTEEPGLLERVERSQCPEDLYLQVDPPCLYRVLANLLGNARKYGGPHIFIAARVLKMDAPSRLPACPLALQYRYAVLLTISDDGSGINANAREEMFQPFWRASPDPARQGTGLGLWLSRELGVGTK